MSRLAELARRLGVETVYTDGLGRRHEVSPQALSAILATFGYRDASETQADEALRTLAEERRDVPAPPPRAYEPPELAEGGRVWVLSAQLYTLRSARNWGIGDFTDLLDLVLFSARMGAAGVALNPLHALFLDDPERASPYTPNSRLFLNPLYIDPEAVPEFDDAALPARDRIDALRRADLIDYAGVARIKRAVFESLYAAFRAGATAERRAAFRAYQAREGEPLRRYATYEALRETMRARDPELAYWRRWPESFRRPDAPGVAGFVADNLPRIEFYEYLQWLCDQQLAAAADAARAAGMTIGLYLDLAVGTDDGGADGWMYQDLLAQGFAAGAPPDPWSEVGQSWGFPPVNPRALKADNYRMLAAVLRANMRHAGALRIDHILGLMRMFWIPAGGAPADGVYVRYPFEELVAVIAAESRANRCLVVGEDLGSVPEGLRPALHAAGIYTSAILYFERNDTGFCPPAEYPAQAAAAITTHDLPTFAGWWSGRDIAVREELGRPGGGAEDRARQREELEAAFAREGLGGDPLIAAHRYLARTPSRLIVAQLADIAGDTEQVNLPGTYLEYPNWRRKLPYPLDALFADRRMGAVAAAIAAERPRAIPETAALYPRRTATPATTYRLQLSARFTFDQARALLPYLNALGVSHVYASSFLKARPGSTHGYDIIDHNALNPELGDQESFDRLCDALRALDMGLILDFVPNHMGVGRADNEWWLDLLAWGQASPYAPFFDIRWQPHKRALHGKVLLPFLGDHYGTVLEKGELAPRFDRARGEFDIWYHEHRFPLRPRHYALFIQRAFDAHIPLPELAAGALRELAHEFATLRPEGLARRRQVTVWFKGCRLQTRLAALARDDAVAQWLEKAAECYAGTPGNAATYRNLHRLLERQAYRLAFWRVATEEINYRRFFDINELVAIRQEVPALFHRTHRLVARLIRDGRLQGLRIDHIDGLFSPRAYLRELAAAARAWGGAPIYLAVEKILEQHEALPRDWAVAGTTGYEFAALLTRLFTAADGEAAIDRAYRSFTGDFTAFEDTARECKRMVMDAVLPNELNMLAEELDGLSELHWRTRDYTFGRLKLALREVIAHFPIYRTYISRRRCPPEDRRIIEGAVAAASRAWIGADRELFEFVRAALTGDLAKDRNGYSRNDVFRFAMRFQQYTGPVMAKAIEDTAFYRFVRLVSHNEVGGDPKIFAVTPAEFHAANQKRLADWPHTLIATATHDTKRGEDARTRIAALSELADGWADAVARWRALNHSAVPAPSPRDEYLAYQALVGHWPEHEDSEFRDRMKAYLQKAVREAKLESSWADPNEAYEKACADFIDRCFDNTAFMVEIRPFARRIARLGRLAGLAQLVLKCTVPGVPDFYQGTEAEDLSFVDPDNRRPVDFARLGDTAKRDVMRRLLALRRRHPALFARGAYTPLTVSGGRADHVVAFSRSDGPIHLVVVVGRLFAPLVDGDRVDWQDTVVELPGERARAADLLGNRPAAVLLDQISIL